jgi:hypothetical protein
MLIDLYPRRLRGAFAGLLAAGALAAFYGPTGSAQGLAELRGIVRNAATGEPLDRVHIQLLPGGAPEAAPVYGAITGRDGRFSIQATEPGAYLVRPVRPGFYYSPQQGASAIPAVRLARGTPAEEYRIDMQPQGVLSGRVTNGLGEPLRKAAVRAEAAPPESVSLSFWGAGFATTNDRGEYRMSVPAGRYRIRAEASESSLTEASDLPTASGRPVT